MRFVFVFQYFLQDVSDMLDFSRFILIVLFSAHSLYTVWSLGFSSSQEANVFRDNDSVFHFLGNVCVLCIVFVMILSTAFW